MPGSEHQPGTWWTPSCSQGWLSRLELSGEKCWSLFGAWWRWFLNDHFKWFVIWFHSYLSPIRIGVELLQSINDFKKLFLDLQIASFGIRHLVACICYGVAVLQWDCSKPLVWPVALQGDSFCWIIIFENWSIANQLFHCCLFLDNVEIIVNKICFWLEKKSRGH